MAINDSQIQKAKASNNTSLETFGVPLTNDEMREMERRLEIQETHILDLRSYLEEQNIVVDNMYINQKEGGIVYVGTKLNALQLSELEYSANEKYINNMVIKFYNVDYTEEELDNLLIRILDSKTELAEYGIKLLIVEVDIINQEVLLGTENSVENNEIIDKLFPNEPIRTYVTVAPEDHQVRGGEEIRGVRGNGCSAGYSARNNSGQTFIVTTSHCSRIETSPGTGNWQFLSGEGWFNSNSSYIGHASGSTWEYYGAVDAMGIAVNSNLTSRDININGGIRRLNSIQSNSNDIVGQVVCRTGYASSVSCGQLLSRNVGFPRDGSTFFNLRMADYTTIPGDSGGTVYANFTLLGINKGTHQGNGVYSHVGNVNQRLGLTTILN